MAAPTDFFRIYIDIHINKDVEPVESLTLARSAILPLQDLTIRQLGDEVLKRYTPDEEYRDFEFEVGGVRNARKSKLHGEDRVGDLVRCDEELGVVLLAVQRLASTRDLEENGRNGEGRVGGGGVTRVAKRRRGSPSEPVVDGKRRRVGEGSVRRAEHQVSHDMDFDVVVPESQVAVDGHGYGGNGRRSTSPVLGDDADVDVSMHTAPETSEAMEASPPAQVRKFAAPSHLTNGKRSNGLSSTTVPPQRDGTRDLEEDSDMRTLETTKSRSRDLHPKPSLAAKAQDQTSIPPLLSNTKLAPSPASSTKKPSKLRRVQPSMGSRLSQIISPSNIPDGPEDEVEDAERNAAHIPSIESDIDNLDTTADFVANSQVVNNRSSIRSRARDSISEDLNQSPEALSIHTSAAVGYDTPAAILNDRRHLDVDTTEDSVLSPVTTRDIADTVSPFQNVASSQRSKASIFRCKPCNRIFGNGGSLERHNRKFHADRVASTRKDMTHSLSDSTQSETPSNSYVRLGTSLLNQQTPRASQLSKLKIAASRSTPQAMGNDRTSATISSRSEDDISRRSPSKAKKVSEPAATMFTKPCTACQNADRVCTPNLKPRAKVCQPCNLQHRSHKMCGLDHNNNPLILYSAASVKTPSHTQTKLTTFANESRSGDESTLESPSSPDILTTASRTTRRKVIDRVRSQSPSKVDDVAVEDAEAVDATHDPVDEQSEQEDPVEEEELVQEGAHEEDGEELPARAEDSPEQMDEDERQVSDDDDEIMSDRSEAEDTRQLESQVAHEVSTSRDHEDEQDEGNDEDSMAGRDDLSTLDVEDASEKVDAESISDASAGSQMSVDVADENVTDDPLPEVPHTPEPTNKIRSPRNKIGNESQPKAIAVQSGPKNLSESEADSASESERGIDSESASDASSDDEAKQDLDKADERSDSNSEAESDEEDDVNHIEEEPQTVQSKEDSMSPTPKSQIDRESTLHMSSSKATAVQSLPVQEDDSDTNSDSDSNTDTDIKNVEKTETGSPAIRSQSSASPSLPPTRPIRSSPRNPEPSSSLLRSKTSPKSNIPQSSTARISPSIETTTLAQSQPQHDSNSDTDTDSDPDADIPNTKKAPTSSPSSASQSSASPPPPSRPLRSSQRTSKPSQQPSTSKPSPHHKPTPTKKAQKPSSSPPSSPTLQTQLPPTRPPQKPTNPLSRPAQNPPPFTRPRPTQSQPHPRTAPPPSRPSQPRLLSQMAAESQLRPAPAPKPVLASAVTKARAQSLGSGSETEESESESESEAESGDSEDEVSEDTGFSEVKRGVASGNGNGNGNGRVVGGKGKGSGKGISAILKHVGRAKRRSAAFGR